MEGFRLCPVRTNALSCKNVIVLWLEATRITEEWVVSTLYESVVSTLYEWVVPTLYE